MSELTALRKQWEEGLEVVAEIPVGYKRFVVCRTPYEEEDFVVIDGVRYIREDIEDLRYHLHRYFPIDSTQHGWEVSVDVQNGSIDKVLKKLAS